MDEVRPTDDVEPVVEMVSAPTPIEANQAPEDIAGDHTDTERETVPVSPPWSPMSTAATTVVAGKAPTELTVRSTREDTNEIMVMPEKTMEKVYEWSKRIEAQNSATAERDVTIGMRRLANCEEASKQKAAALMEAEQGQVELRKALQANDTELTKVRAKLDAEHRSNTKVEQLRSQLREVQADA
jgi:hypothetical protein